ncbi:uncharacterized protein AB9X84_002520 [Acanthopagrus schlegelii]
MSALAGAVLAYNKDDMMLLGKAVRSGNQELYATYSDEEMISFLKPCQIRSYDRLITRGVDETASVIKSIIAEFKETAGLDIDGIHLFKSTEAVDAHWATASKHLSCMQVYLIAWNNQTESLRVAGGQGRQMSCMDARQIQRMNRQAEVLFGKDHVLEPNFAVPMPYTDQYRYPEEEELLGVEYAMCQSKSFTARNYYAQRGQPTVTQKDCSEEAYSTWYSRADSKY